MIKSLIKIYFTIGFLDSLKELLSDSNPMVVANAVAALSEINEASPTGRPLIEMNAATINKLLTALNECTEWGQVFILDSLSNYTPKVANIYFFAKLGPKK